MSNWHYDAPIFANIIIPMNPNYTVENNAMVVDILDNIVPRPFPFFASGRRQKYKITNNESVPHSDTTKK
jgi:hypothetical protein